MCDGVEQRTKYARPDRFKRGIQLRLGAAFVVCYGRQVHEQGTVTQVWPRNHLADAVQYRSRSR